LLLEITLIFKVSKNSMSEKSYKLNIGWLDTFEADFAECSAGIEDALAGRIVREDRGLYRSVVGE
jgi:hypothetical protein